MRFRALPIALGLALWTAAPGTPRAADPSDPTQPSLGTTAYPAPTLHGELQLSLSDAIAMGLENNLNIEIERHRPLIAYEDHRIAWGFYDPELVAEFGYSDERSPNTFSLNTSQVAIDERTGGSGGFQGLLPWAGTSYSLTVDTSRLITNSTISALSPEYRSGISVVARQPLLRGLIWNEPWTLVKTSHVVYRGSTEDFRRRLMDIVQSIEDAYWALIAEDERVGVAEKSVETAQALLDQVQTQYEVGVVSKVEIAQAEAGLARRDFELIVQQNRYQTTMDQLIDLVLGANLTADSRIQIQPTDRPDDYLRYDVDVENAARLAIENRPELALANREIERLEINMKFAKNQRLPQLDVVGSYGYQGASGQGNANLDPNFGSPPPDQGSWHRSFGHNTAPSYSVRGILSIPIPNTAGRHSVSKAELELRRARVQRRRVEQTIILEVRDAVRNLLSAQEGIEASEREVVAAAEQLRAERIRLEYGESTPFDVLLREEDFVDAEARKIGAFQTYRSSVTGLDRFQGTILRNRNISIDQASRLR
jgi:outer membrane protein TolC